MKSLQFQLEKEHTANRIFAVRLNGMKTETFVKHPSQDLETADAPHMLVGLMANCLELRPWETIDVLNGTRLIANVPPRRHEGIEDLFSALRRQETYRWACP